MSSYLQIYSDGGARGNPGLSAGAFIVIDKGKIIHKDSAYFGYKTNNEAEYEALIAALSWLAKNIIIINNKKVLISMDSELVVNQLTGRYRIKNEKLKLLAAKAKRYEEKLGVEVFYKSIPRSKNKLADKLLNKVLDEKRK